MHMWHHVTNHLIISNDKDFNSENRIKLRVRDITPLLKGQRPRWCYDRLAVVSDLDNGGFALNVDKELRGSAVL
jgi:hypothetical protein